MAPDVPEYFMVNPIRQEPAFQAEDEDLDPSCACLCCWDVLVDPVTLLCQHTFCLHCLALWFDVSERDVCPQCLEEWFIYPEIDVELRDTVNGLFYSSVQRRRSQIQRDARISRSLRRLERYRQAMFLPRLLSFIYLLVTALSSIIVLVSLIRENTKMQDKQDQLTTDPATKWNPNDVASWLDMMGPWAEQYKEAFKQGIDYGRSLVIPEEDLQKPVFNMEDKTHGDVFLDELKTLWEFKAPIDQKSLFLMLAMKFSPRLTMLYLYVFDYYDAFLPFLHACCPNTDASSPMDTTWLQWAEFLFKYCVLPFQLAGEYTWNLVSDQSWTFFFIFLNAMLLSVLEFCILFRLFFFSSIRDLCTEFVIHVRNWLVIAAVVALVWHCISQFAFHCLVFLGLFLSPLMSFHMLLRMLQFPEP